MLNQSGLDPAAGGAHASARRRPCGAGTVLAARSGTVEKTLTLAGSGPVRYRLAGNESNPLAIVLGGISADRQIDRWWPEVTGADGVLSTRRFRQLSIDWPGTANDRSTSVDDFADLLAAVLDALGVARVRAFVGASFGAMVGLAFAARHPARIGRLIAISGAHRSTPAATAGRVIQRRIIESLARLGDAARGVALARSLALTSYRPAGLFDQRFYAADPEETLSGIEQYLEYNGASFAERFDATRYLALSSALDRHCVDPASIRCRTELIGVTSDDLVPVSQLRELAGAIGIRARLHLIESPFGHDAFLKSTELLNPLLERLLDDCDGEHDHE